MIVVRSCKQDMTSHNGFQWPETGFIEAPDWNDTPQCGHGLHALRPGDNNPGEWHAGKYLAVETHDSPIIDLGGKVKFRRGEVLHVADNMHDLSLWLTGHGSPGPWYYGSATAGDRGTATVGEYGIIQITWWDGARKRITIGYVGEMGIEPNVKYRLNDKHEFEKADG